MRRMSFALTTAQILNKTKTVTRRNGWDHLKEGDLIQPIEKGMGLQKGEKQNLLGCPIVIRQIDSEELQVIDKNDCTLEGFPDMDPDQFIDMYMKANKCQPNHVVKRIRFDYCYNFKEGDNLKKSIAISYDLSSVLEKYLTYKTIVGGLCDYVYDTENELYNLLSKDFGTNYSDCGKVYFWPPDRYAGKKNPNRVSYAKYLLTLPII